MFHFRRRPPQWPWPNTHRRAVPKRRRRSVAAASARQIARAALVAATLVGCLLAAGPVRGQPASYPPARARSGMVAADSDLASEVGAEILARGGNAADAAVATALVLGVVRPFASGIGGGGFALVYMRDTGRVVVFDFREQAPAAAHRDLFVVDGVAQPELSRHSGLAVGVPGELAGLWAIHQRFGSLPWEALVEPAARLAEEGFSADYLFGRRVESARQLILERPALARLLTRADGQLIAEGDVVRRPGLARVLRAVAAMGPEAFYRGPVAEAIVAAVAGAGGVMTLDDLAAYDVVMREPLVGHYRGYTLYTMPPPSSGGTTMLAALNILEHFPIGEMDPGSSRFIHAFVEAFQFAFADRAVYLGDPDFVEVPVGRLVDSALAAARAARIRPGETLPHTAYGSEVRQVVDDAGTSHFSVVDAERNMVALTTTINLSFGSMVVAGETEIILNNEMDDFSAQPGAANAFGLVGTEANAVAPRKRPLSSMSPTLVLRDGVPFLSLGGSGGPLIISGTAQVLINVVDFGMTVQQAVDAPRFHHQWTPDLLFVEPAIPVDVTDNLRRRGHQVRPTEHGGAVQVIRVAGDWLFGASDPRKTGHPRGVQ